MIALYRAWFALTRMDLDLFLTDRDRTRLTIRATRREGLTVMLAREPYSDGAA